MGFSKQIVFSSLFIIAAALNAVAKSEDFENEDLVCSGHHTKQISTDPYDIGFYFYPAHGTRQQERKIEYNNLESLKNSGFNENAEKTVILIAGFTDNRTIHMPPLVLEAYLKSNLNYNYIIVDWGRLSGNCYLPDILSHHVDMFELYTLVVKQSIPIVVSRTTEFINFLGVDPEKIHLIGHSLGAHVSGGVGALYQKQHEGTKIARITGLDPAGPLFEPKIFSETIDRSDAAFVDIIHSNMGGSGGTAADGHVDFYPNGGVMQPGCLHAYNGTDLDLLARVNSILDCDHQFAPILYAASVLKQIPSSCKCYIVRLGLNLTLAHQVELCLLTCPLFRFGRTTNIYMGLDCPTSARGQYTLRTTNPP